MGLRFFILFSYVCDIGFFHNGVSIFLIGLIQNCVVSDVNHMPFDISNGCGDPLFIVVLGVVTKSGIESLKN